MPNNKIHIHGQLIEIYGQSLHGYTIQAMELHGKSLGRETPKEGHFEFSIASKRFKTKARLVYFRVWKGRKQLQPDTSDFLVWSPEQPQQPIVIYVDTSTGSVVLQKDKRTISGRVLEPNGTAIPRKGLRVEAFDHGLQNKRQKIGETETREDGSYELTYWISNLTSSGKQAGDISIALSDPSPQGPEKGPLELYTSEIIFNAKQNEQKDLIVDHARYRGPSEFDRLAGALGPVSEGVQPGEWQEKDIAFLAGKTGQDAFKIAFMAEASKLLSDDDPKAKNGFQPAFLFALFKQQLPTKLAGLLSHDPADLRKSLEKAFQANTISYNQYADEAEATIQTLKAWRTEFTVDQFSPVFKTLSNFSKAKQAEFVAQFYHRKGSVKQFWEEAKQPGSPFVKFAEKLQFSLQTGLLCWGHVPFIKALNNKRAKSFEELAGNDVAAWQEILEQSGLPTPFAQLGEKDYAKALTTFFDRAYPTAAIAYRLKKENKADEKDLIRFFENAGVIRKNTSKQKKETPAPFDLMYTHIDQYFKENETVTANVKDKEKLIAQVKEMQRLARIPPAPGRFDAIRTLQKEGFHSAREIAALGQNQFVKKMGKKLGNAEQGRMVHARARKMRAFVDHFMWEYHPGSNQTDTNVTKRPGLPEWAEMFGAGESCQYKHCQTVLSPAAYLFELLDFLKNEGKDCLVKQHPEEQNKTCTKSPLDLLLERRPKIAHIKLNCENALTPVPYIDLVNEILENAVAPMEFTINDPVIVDELGQQVISQNLKEAFLHSPAGYLLTEQAFLETDAPSSRWRITDLDWEYTLKKSSNGTETVSVSALPLYQTMNTEKELDANPAYFNPDAYQKLEEAVFPWNLPFDLSSEEARRFLAQIKVPRYRLMELCQKEGSPSDMQISGEYFGISPAECALITTERPDSPWEQYGFSEEYKYTWVMSLKNLSTFLGRSGLTFEELEELLEITFIQSKGSEALAIQFEDGSCALEDANLIGLKREHLIDIHRFVRLWRHLDWSMHELDRAIEVLNKGKLDEQFLIKLQAVHLLNSGVKIPVQQQLCWWGLIDTRQPSKDEPSQYEALFLNKTVLNPADGLFVLSEDGNELQSYLDNPGEHKLKDVKPALQAAMRISERELDQLIEQELLTTLESSDEVIRQLDQGEIPDVLQTALASKSIFVSASGTGLDYATLEVVDEGTSWRIRKAELTLSLQKQDEEISVFYTDQAEVDSDLNLANLSSLYRWVSLATTRNCSISEILVAKDLLREDPFEKDDVFSPEHTLSFVNDLDFIISSNLPVTEIDQLLRLQDGNSEIKLPQESITAFLTDLRNELQRLKSTFSSESDPHGEKTKASWKAYLDKKKEDFDWTESELEDLQAIVARTPYAFLGSVDFDEFKNDLVEGLVSENLVKAFSMLGLSIPQGSTIELLQESFLWKIEETNKTFYLRKEDKILVTYRHTSLDPLSPDQESLVRRYFVDGLSLEWETIKKQLLEYESEDFISTKDLRFQFVLAQLSSQLWHIQSTALVVHKVSEFLSVDLSLAELLCLRWMNRMHEAVDSPSIEAFLDPAFVDESDAISFIQFPTLYRAMTKWHHASWLIQHFDLAIEDLPVVFQPLAGWQDEKMDLNLLPFELRNHAGTRIGMLKKLAGFYHIREMESISMSDLVSLLSMAEGPEPDNLHLFEKAISDLTSWPLAETRFCIHAFGYELSAFSDPAPWLRLVEVFQLAQKAAVKTPVLLDWGKPEISSSHSRAIKQTLKSRYTPEQWEQVAKPLIDPLRQRRKDCLVAYLLQQGEWQSEYDLYAHFLIDTEMSPCMTTTRIKLAISSVQLFIQRLLMNLEEWAIDSVNFTNWQAQWEWMKNYRVWEANRKVFLFPENWTEPELRDDKTPFFKELEEELLQNEINEEHVEKAYLHYLEKLDEVARLEICGQYHEREATKHGGEIVIDRLHVFGRTKGDPPKYYYRMRDNGLWTAWEAVNLDIKENYLLPLVWNRRLFLLWPVLEKKNNTITSSLSSDEINLDKYLEELKKPFEKVYKIVQEAHRTLDSQLTIKGLDQTNRIRSLLNKLFYLPFSPANLMDDYLIAISNVNDIINKVTTDIDDDLRGCLFDIEYNITSAIVYFYDYDNDTQEWTETKPMVSGDINQFFFAYEHVYSALLALEENQQYFEKHKKYKREETQSIRDSWSLRLAWSEFRYNKWTAKIVSQTVLDCDTAVPEDKDKFFFTSVSENEQFKIHVYAVKDASSEGEIERTYIGNFTLAKSDFKLEAVPNNPVDTPLFGPSKVDYRFGRAVENANENSLELCIAVRDGDQGIKTTLLDKTPGQFTIPVPHEVSDFLGQVPFFYEDDSRTFLVLPEGNASVTEEALPPDQGEPAPGPGDDWPPYENPPLDPSGPSVGVVDVNPPYDERLGFEKIHIPEDMGGFDTIKGILEGMFDGDIVSDFDDILRENDIVLTGDAFVESFLELGRGQKVTDAVGIGQLSSVSITDGATNILVEPITGDQGFENLEVVEGRGNEILQDDSIVTEPVDSNDFGTHSPSVQPYGLGFSRKRKTQKADNNYEVDLSDLGFRFETFYHPFVREYINIVKRDGIEGLLRLKNQKLEEEEDRSFDFDEHYKPNTSVVKRPYPVENVDFEDGAYAQYNWELFFHIPLLIADSLSKNQKFDKAQQWFHFIFNPTNKSEESIPARYWLTKPFFDYFTRKPKAEQSELIELLKKEKSALEKQIDSWEKDPFKPHVIARLRNTTYPMVVVMKYLDNLLNWADQLFQRDSIESINEANNLYILVAEILGARPKTLPKSGNNEAQSFAVLQSATAVPNSAWMHLENHLFPSAQVNPILFNSRYSQMTFGGAMWLSAMPRHAVQLKDKSSEKQEFIYFGIPENKKLLGYWDTVSDRLFKIRNCMNIEGVKRELPLFAPPIDPGMLVRAVAAGMDIGAAISSLFTPLPHYRFNYIYQRALDFCNDVKSLGSALLTAIEKRDAEELSLIRLSHEKKLLQVTRTIKEHTIEEAGYALESLKETLSIAEMKESYYRSRSENPINRGEKAQLDLMMIAHMIGTVGQMLEMAASSSYPVPDSYVGTLLGWAGGAITLNKVAGGEKTGQAIQAFGKNLGVMANHIEVGSKMSGILAGYARRKEDWDFQAAIALIEQSQINNQILAAEIKKAVAEKDLDNHDLQIEQRDEIARFMEDKFSNKQLYNWMIGKLSSLYFQSYQMALKLAQQAEKALAHELGLENTVQIKPNYWDNLKKGLLSGEQLYYDLKRLEVTYLEKNKREKELTKHISLATTDPAALLALQETGSCFINIPELLFDLDHPGQYMRRIKSVSLTIPCVTGAYTGVSAKLTLLSNRMRKKALHTGDYTWTGFEDDRFDHNVVGIQSIATSHAQADSGLFELNFRDERYLPFEGAGAISTWRLELPSEFRQFDYDTISDVIIHMNYTARDGGETFKASVNAVIRDRINAWIDELAETKTGLPRLFSLKQHFPNEWNALLHADPQATTMPLSQKHYPHFLKNEALNTKRFTMFMKGEAIQEEALANLTIKLKDPEDSESPFDCGDQISKCLAFEGWSQQQDQYGDLWVASVNLETESGIQFDPNPATSKLLFVGEGQQLPEGLEDILILVNYLVVQ